MQKNIISEIVFSKIQNGGQYGRQNCKFSQIFCILLILTGFFSWTTIKSRQIIVLGAKNIISEIFFQNSKWRPIWPPKSINLRNFDAIQSILTEVFYRDLNRIKKNTLKYT